MYKDLGGCRKVLRFYMIVSVVKSSVAKTNSMATCSITSS